MSFAFDPWQPAASNFAQESARQLLAALDTARNAELSSASRIHDARTCCKRARGVLRIVGPAFPAYRAENAAIRNAAAVLSRARDAGTMQASLALLTGHGGLFSASEVNRLEAAIAASGPPADVGESAALDAFVAALEPVYVRARLWHVAPLGWEDVAAGAARTYRAARRAMKRAAQSLDATAFHEWRKQAKYHWYHLRLLRRFDPDRFGHARENLKRLARMLGTHHDLEVLAAHADAQLSADAELARRMGEVARRRQDAIAAEALTIGADVFGSRPRDWGRTLRSQLDAATRHHRAHAPETA